MWRAGRLVLALLVVSAGTGPSAYATPDGQSTQVYGQSPAWGGCERFLGDTTAIPTARCGTVSVPFDYAKPEGAQAQLAVIRVPATAEKIGVLVVNPGGPGSSAVDTVAGMGAGLADSEIATALRPGGHRPPRRRTLDAGTALPQRRRIRRVPPRTDGRLQPGRRGPHRAAVPPVRGVVHREDGHRFPGRHRHGFRGVGHGRCTRRARREPDQLPGFLLRYRARRGLRRALSRPGAGHGPRRCHRPPPGPDRQSYPPNGRIPNGVQRLRG